VQWFGHLIEHAFQIVSGFCVSAGAQVGVAGMPICGQTPFLGVGGLCGQNTSNPVLKKPALSPGSDLWLQRTALPGGGNSQALGTVRPIQFSFPKDPR
jgi:hypothetical protein